MTLPKFKNSSERLKYFYNHYYASISSIKRINPNQAKAIEDYVDELENRLKLAISTLKDFESGEAMYSAPVYDQIDLEHNLRSTAVKCLDEING